MSMTVRQASAVALAETIASWQVRPGSYILVGRSQVQLPKNGSARSLSAASGVGIFRTESWKLSDGCSYGFAAIIRLPGLVPSYLADIALRGSRLSDREFLLEVTQRCDCLELGSQLAALAVAHHGKVARFLIDIETSIGAEETLDAAGLLRSYLNEAAEEDGHIELILSIHDRRVILQGWGTRLVEPVCILIPGAERPIEKLALCEFQRSDVPVASIGCILVGDLSVSGLDLNSESVFLLAGDKLIARRTVGSQMLFADDALGQLRHLLPKLRGPESLHAELKALLQPIYQGIDTLAGAGRSVRAAIDLAVSSCAGRVYISGWILDPSESVVDIEVSNGVTHHSILEKIVWIERDDVVSAFKAEFNRDSHLSLQCGFSALAELADSNYDHLHLRICFKDGDIAFLPVRHLSFDNGEQLSRILSSVDLYKSSGEAIISTVLGPFLRQTLAEIHAANQNDCSTVSEELHAVIIPIRRGQLPRSLVSALLHDKLLDNEKLVLLCDASWDNSERCRLLEFVEFYGHKIEVLFKNLQTFPIKSIVQVVHSIGAKKSILLAHDVSGANSEVRTKLYKSLDRFDFVCPTILQEDGTVQYAGSITVELLERVPFSRVRAGSVGAMSKFVRQPAKLTMPGGSLACCGIRSDAVPALLGAEFQLTRMLGEAALFARSEQLGLRGKWDSSITVVAPDDGVDEPPVKHVVDSWLLRCALEAV